MNLSKNNSDLLRSPLKIGGGTPESARLPPLLGGSTGGGAGALIVAPMYSKPLVSIGAVTSSREWVWERPLDRGKFGTGRYCNDPSRHPYFFPSRTVTCCPLAHHAP